MMEEKLRGDPTIMNLYHCMQVQIVESVRLRVFMQAVRHRVTPYARIDANHRREISEKFFPNISDQVIILSTDEEINEEYYKIIKPYISKEYLLINDENENRTTIENNYFFEV